MIEPWLQVMLSIFAFIAVMCTLAVCVLAVNSIREWWIIRTIAKYTGTVPDQWPRFRQTSWDYPDTTQKEVTPHV